MIGGYRSGRIGPGISQDFQDVEKENYYE